MAHGVFHFALIIPEIHGKIYCTHAKIIRLPHHEVWDITTWFVVNRNAVVFVLEKMSFCWKAQSTQISDGKSSISIDRFSTECTSTRHKTGTYNGILVFIKFIEFESLTLSRDEVRELELVRCWNLAIWLLRIKEL